MKEVRMFDESFMILALEEARKAEKHGDVPIGAVVVKEGVVVGRGQNRRELLKDPTAHAEMIAIRDAAEFLGSWYLTGCDMYVTIEPCVMCAGALVLARIERVVFGSRDIKAGGVSSLYNLTNDERLNHQVQVVEGIMHEECSEVVRAFFKKLRARGKRY